MRTGRWASGIQGDERADDRRTTTSADRRNAGADGSSERINRPWLVLRRGPDRARPRRLRVRYERTGRSLYSAATAGGVKMTPDQIAEVHRLAREWKPKGCTGSAG
jgi:hypothetical protein